MGTREDTGGAWVVCFAGCTAREIAHALGATLDHLGRPPPRLSATAWIRTRRLERGFPAPKAGGSPRSQGYRHEAFHSYGPGFRKERLRPPRHRGQGHRVAAAQRQGRVGVGVARAHPAR